MICLQTLGSVDLRDSEGAEVRSILVQPKRLGLLVYLALAGAGRFRRRDLLISMFWPELDEEHARGALRQALRFLRNELGAGALVSRGDEEIGVDPQVMECDALEFEAAVARQDWNRALEQCRGELLAGLFVGDVSPEFERWLEEQRLGLRRRTAQAAWALVEAALARDDPVAAVPWAHRAVELFPDDEAGLRRLMRILDRRGDRAGALHAYEVFRRRLQAEYDATPSPETDALLAAIRSRDVPVWESPLKGWPPHPPEPSP